MQKIKLSKKLLGESIVYCENYLYKKRQRPLPNKIKKAIKKLIEKKRKDNDKIADAWLKSSMLRLAVTKLYQEGKAIPIEIDGETKYNYNLREVFLKMDEILNEADKKEMTEQLREFCK